ncbi:fibronectin type III domain-containing protein [Flavobacterium sp. PS2]|uniref:fibronectin type III domain-containing protein n=1 Tax=Flavobacterium sp. PS2 TaxID=3384157 RepID=UPI00390CB6EF
MLKKLKLQLFLTLGFLLLAFTGVAQTYPVTISTQLTQPSPIYLNNYADATTINSPIKVQLILNDLSISNRQVRLKCYFQGNGVSFLTNDFVVGARALYLEGGFPLQLTNVDLAPYFQFQNIQGINPNQYAQALPEGIYTFSVEVYDFATGKKLSRKTSVTTIIFQNDPPFLNLPLNNASIMQQNIQNIIFSWTPRQINVSNVEYEFALVEIWDKYTPVQNAFAYSPPLYTTTTRATTLQYSLSEPQLIPGKRYAWRIKAKALANAEEVGVFKNNGYSEIYSFTYEVFCTAPLAITTTAVSQDQAKISWSGNIDNYDYQVNYREKNANSEWYKLVSPREYATIANLKPNTTYEYTVGASCDLGKYTHSTIKEFTTMASDEIAFAGCGIKPDPNDLVNKNPLPNLFPNDVVTAGDFPIVVLHSSGSNGTFTGDGYVTLPFLEKFRKLIDAADALGGEKIDIGKFSRIRITFNNIGVNTDFKLISGEIIASYDPTWKGVGDLDPLVNDVFGDAGNVVQHDVQFVIDKVTKNPDGSITITSPDGVTAIIEKTVNDIVITDKDGKQFAVPADAPTGDIAQTGKLAPGGIPTSKNTNGMGSGGDVTQISSEDVTVVFSKGDGFYAFDVAPTTDNGSLSKTYVTIPQKNGNPYNVNYKAISDSPNSTDVVIATATFKNGKTKDDIVFKTQNGTEIKPTWSDNVASLGLKRTLDFAKESIIATVKPAAPKDPKDPKAVVGKYDIAGTMDMWHLTQKSINLKVISINNAPITNVESDLNAIYNKAGIKFNVATQNVNLPTSYYPKNTIECGDSGWLAQYTAEQQAIIAYIKTQITYEKDSYYVLVTNIPSSKGLAGFMPLKRQFGFVFSKATDKEEDKGSTVKTMAHELGHGVFGLQHPFTEYKTTSPTNLLMDYGTGTEFSHNDWQVLHAPGLQLYLFQGDEAGEFSNYVMTPNYDIVSITQSNTIHSGGITVPPGTLPGFIVYEQSTDKATITKKKYYLWDAPNKNYKNTESYSWNQTNSKFDVITNSEPITGISTTNDKAIINLFYNLTDCPAGLLITKKSEIGNDYKSEKALLTFIDANKSKASTIKCYSFTNNLSSGEKNQNPSWSKENNVPINCSGIDDAVVKVNIDNITKAIDDQTKDFKALELIFKNNISTCVLEKLPFDLRNKILNRYYTVTDDADWEISYSTLSTGDHFFIKDVILTTPKDQQKMLVQQIKNDNYKWVTKLYDQGKTIKGFGNDVNYNQVAEIFLSLGKWSMENYDSLKIDPTKKQFSYNTSTNYYPGQQPFLLGIGDYKININSGKDTESKIISTSLDVNNGRIGFYNKYNLIDLRTYISAAGSPSPKRDGVIEYKEDYNPFEPITIIAGTPNKFDLKVGQEYVVPAIVALAYQGVLKENFAAENLRQLSNSVMIVSGTLAAPFSGGGSLVAVAASISTAGVAVGLVDNYMQAEIKNGRLDPNSSIYKAWDNTYIAYSVLDAGAGVSNIAFNSYRALSTVGFINNFKNFEGIINTSNAIKPGAVLNGLNEIKTVVAGGTADAKLLNSIKIFNNFDNLVSPFKNFVKKTTIYSAMAIQIATTDVAAINKVSNTIELTINATKAEISTAEVLLQISNKTPQLAEDLNNAAFISIKNAPDAIAQEGKMALANINNDSFIIATQINNQVIYNVFNLTGATPHFYQSTKNSSSEQNPKCDYCPEINTLDSELCKRLTLLANNTNNSTGVKNICSKGISLTIVNKLLTYDKNIQKTFLEDFVYASQEVIKNFELSSLDLWKRFNIEFKGRKYITDEGQFQSCKNVADKHPSGYLGNLVKKVMEANPPSNQEQVVVGVTHQSFGGEVLLGYNFKKSEKSEEDLFLSTGCHPLLRDRIKYMNFIRNSVIGLTGNVTNPELANRLLDIDKLDKLTRAGRAGFHGEIRALSTALYKLGNKATEQSLSEFDMFIRSNGDNVMQRCPCCFHISFGVKVLEGK